MLTRRLPGRCPGAPELGRSRAKASIRGEAPEVQAILRLHEAGLRVDEVPVQMRARASGESKLQGRKGIMVVLTIAGTLLALERWRRR
jgi:hypothetical protein